MTTPGDDAPPDAERLRQAAAAWFARLRAPDGETSRPAFEAWRDADPAHAAAYERMERVWSRGAVLAAARPGQGRPRRRRGWPGLAWGAAAGLGAAAAVGLTVLAGPASLQLEAASIVWPRVSTRIDQIRRLDLPDGSRVTLDSDTVLATHFAADIRQVRLLRGRARFDVVDERRRFVVDAGHGAIETRKALFDVSVRPGRSASVTALGGRLEANDLDALAGASRAGRTLVAGERLTIDGRTGGIEVAAAPAGDQLWPEGLLDFRGAPLGEALAEANRYSLAKIVLADPSLASLRISGVFKAGANTDLAASLAAMFHLELSRSDTGGYVLSRAAAAS
ncbi:MAG: FecR domain-containing protein [Caulobacteraceae bacterium]|nr:FecR domain-containing protein [Caulobacteraceae bacterium]